MTFKTAAQSMRLPFLVLTPVCVFLGASTVFLSQGSVSVFLLILVLLGALFAHISVNMLNEYFDFKSGLDMLTKRTPFSGGSGALPQNPEMARVVLSVGAAALLASMMIGAFFVWKLGVSIVPIGIVGLVLIVSYTGWINRHPLACLIAPGIGFGFLMVVGTQFVLQGEYTLLPWLVAVVPFFLVNNLLLLNQYPDIQADIRVGRNHFPIVYGVNASNMVYGIFLMITITAILTYIVLGILPVLSLIAFIPMPLAFYALYGAIEHKGEIGLYPQYLGANVAVTIVVPILLAVSIIV